MILEVSPRPFGLGYSVAVWPKARHHIIRLGTREARVIVPNESSPRLMGVLSLLVAGLLLN